MSLFKKNRRTSSWFTRLGLALVHYTSFTGTWSELEKNGTIHSNSLCSLQEEIAGKSNFLELGYLLGRCSLHSSLVDYLT